MSFLPKSAAAALLGVALTTNIASAQPSPEQHSTTRHPLSLTLGLGFPDGASFGLGYNVNRFLSIGAGAGTAGFFRDYQLHARAYPFDTERFHFYVQGGADVMDLRPISPNATPVVLPNLRVGEEFRANNGFTIGVNLGAGLPLNTEERRVVPVGKLYVGWSF